MPISAMDEYNVHQIESTLDHVVSSDPAWQDRLYFNAHDPAGRIAVMCGGGAFPNRNIWNTYINVIHENVQYSMVFTRELDHDRHEMAAGPLSFHILEPLQSWRVRLDENEHDLLLDLRFDARTAPYEFKPIYSRHQGRVVQNWRHYTQGGHYTGTVRVGGETFTRLNGTRDRTWGLRGGGRGGFAIWLSAHFENYWITGQYLESPEGEPTYVEGAIVPDDGSPPLKIVKIEHDFRFEGAPRVPGRMRLQLYTADGGQSGLSAEEAGTIFLYAGAGRHDLTDAAKLDAPPAGGRYYVTRFNFRHEGNAGQGISEIVGAPVSHVYGPLWPGSS